MNDSGMTSPVTVASTQTEYEFFYRREFSRLAVLAGTVAGSRSIGEDIAQEAMTRVHKNWGHVAALDKPGAWARRVTVNLAIGRRRRFTSEAKALFRLGPPVEAVEEREGDPAIWAAVDELPPRQRAVIALHYLEDRTVAEIADILECSVSAATSNLHKARTKLADTLGESHG